MLTLFSIVFVKCVALSVHRSIEGDKEKQLCQDKDRSICIESRKSNLALELVLKRTITDIQKRLTGTCVGTWFNLYLYVETDISDVGNQT